MQQFPEIVEKRKFTIENIKRIESTIFNKDTFVNGLIFRSLGESRFHLLHAAACCDIGEYEAAKQYLRLARSKYSKCLMRTVEQMEKAVPAEKANYLIDLFFDQKYADLSKKWRVGSAFEGTIDLYESIGISFSPRLFMKQKYIDVANKLHIALKKVMLENGREAALDKLFTEISV